MFELYDRLIEGIPTGIPVERVCSGSTLTAVCADGSIGLCETVMDHRRPMTLDSDCRYDLQTLAAYAKSWNYTEASIGMAAINCYYNNARRFMELGLALNPVRRNPYRTLKRALDNRKVAAIGHTPILEDILDGAVQLSVIVENPIGSADYPDSAMEFILESQDAVLMDGRSFVRNQIARLQSNTKHLICHGVGVPLCEMPGVHAVWGFSALNPGEVLKQVQFGVPAVMDGRVEVFGPPNEVMSAGLIQHLYRVDVEVESLHNGDVRVCIPKTALRGKAAG